MGSLVVNFCLWLLYRIVFFKVFQNKKHRITQELMVITTLQMLIFLSYTLFIFYTNKQGIDPIHLLWTFLGLLLFQVLELIQYLKVADKGVD